ncbi:MAG: 4Fe-4S ferredoxin [Deltaproteobacteria bacterium]|nr:MAG: 4Fe-4S ferredoxin [Deltaproteobacteria bacterium]
MHPIEPFISALKKAFPEAQVHTDDLLVKAYSVDASPFEPRALAVVDVDSPEKLLVLLRLAREHNTSLTFRGAGTGVSGQTIAEEVTVRLVGPHWKRIDVLDDGARVRAGCCVVGADLNAALQPYGRFITSDPSSVGSAFIGGMAATNAAGLSCTVEKNIYHMMTDMHFSLMDGTTVDTADPDSVAAFRQSHRDMLDALLGLRRRILDNEEMASRIRRKFSIRNTSGYSLNAFTDFQDPLEILKHLIIGSEGTLAFIHNLTLRTGPIEPFRATAFVGFDSIDTAIQGVLRMEAQCTLHAVEFLNSVSLQSLMQLPEFPDALRDLGDNACALLLETKGGTPETLDANVRQIAGVLSTLKTANPVRFETDDTVCEQLWDLRRALYPILAGTRASEEYAYSEDYCVPIKNLPQACKAFLDILNRNGFTKSGVHGHALHGNLHFSIPLQLNNSEEVRKVALVIDEAANVVLSLDGALKAEHGTGRAVAPFVLREWGEELYQVMRDLKKIIDPEGLLNPNVILNDDSNCHLKNLKYAGPVDRTIDMCVDCGFCEYVCPSGDVGLTSRQRIYTLRTIAGLIKAGEEEKAKRWQKKFDEKGLDTCATDGLCAMRCPLGIDIAQYMRMLRHEATGRSTRGVARKIGDNFALVQHATSGMLHVASAAHKLMGHNLALGSGRLTRKALNMQIPDLREVNLCGGSRVPAVGSARNRDRVVYFPSCAVRTMGYTWDASHPDHRPIMDVAVNLLEKARFQVIIPDKTTGLCCGKSFETKGLFDAADQKAAELNAVLLKATQNGKYPVLCETSPCLARMKKTLDNRLQLMDPVEFVLCHLSHRLQFKQVRRKVALHPTCSMREMGLTDKFRQVAEKCVTEVVVPQKIFCCGFAGDKGFTLPQLNASALKTLEGQIHDCSEGYSTSRTCEVGLTLHGKKLYRNILYLIDECTCCL